MVVGVLVKVFCSILNESSYEGFYWYLIALFTYKDDYLVSSDHFLLELLLVAAM